MTYTEMKNWFNILQDKYGSPYYTDSEITQFLNRAQLDEVVALLPVDGGKLNIELNANTIARIEPLLVNTSAFTMGAVIGEVTKATLETATPTKILRLLAVSYNNIPVKYTRHNNWFTYIQNTFKTPTSTAPRMHEHSNAYHFSPIDPTAVLSFIAVRQPVLYYLMGQLIVNYQIWFIMMLFQGHYHMPVLDPGISC